MSYKRKKPSNPRQISAAVFGEKPVNASVEVRDNNIDQALRALKKKMQREGVFREIKLRQHFEKPSEKKAREKAECIRRVRRRVLKKAQKDGVAPRNY